MIKENSKLRFGSMYSVMSRSDRRHIVYARMFTQWPLSAHLCVCDRACQELLLSCAALFDRGVIPIRKAHTHSKTLSPAPAPENKSKAPFLWWSVPKTKKGPALYFQPTLCCAATLWLSTLQSLSHVCTCESVCVCACVCFRWQWVHFIPNAPVSLLSRTGSHPSFTGKIKAT